MADDKIVTKKTAAKKAVSKKAAAQKTTVGESEAQASAPRPAAKKAASKKSAAKPAAAAPKATKSTAPPVAKPASSGSLHKLANVSPEKRLDMIKEAAYYRAEKRSFAPGHDAEDWAMAEREIDDLIARARQMTGK